MKPSATIICCSSFLSIQPFKVMNQWKHACVLVPFHVKMTILKTQIEKMRKYYRKTFTDYLTKRTVCVILSALAESLKCAEIMGARSEGTTMQPPSQTCTKHIDFNEWNFGVHKSMQDETLPWITMDNGQYYLWKLVIYCVALLVYIYFYFMYYW